MTCSSFRVVEAICLFSTSIPFVALSLAMNLLTRFRTVVALWSDELPEAERSNSVMVSAASASGDCAFGSDSDVYEWEACVRYPWEKSTWR